MACLDRHRVSGPLSSMSSRSSSHCPVEELENRAIAGNFHAHPYQHEARPLMASAASQSGLLRERRKSASVRTWGHIPPRADVPTCRRRSR